MTLRLLAEQFPPIKVLEQELASAERFNERYALSAQQIIIITLKLWVRLHR